MGEVIPIRPQPDQREVEAYERSSAALRIAQANPTLRNMVAAVRAYEAWLAISIPNEVDRRRVWP